MDPKMGFKIGQLDMALANARREIAEHFGIIKKIFNGSYGAMENITVNELTDADLLMWHRVKDYENGRGLVTPADLEKYRKDIAQNRNPSRTALEASIAELLTDLWIKEKQPGEEAQ